MTAALSWLPSGWWESVVRNGGLNLSVVYTGKEGMLDQLKKYYATNRMIFYGYAAVLTWSPLLNANLVRERDKLVCATPPHLAKALCLLNRHDHHHDDHINQYHYHHLSNFVVVTVIVVIMFVLIILTLIDVMICPTSQSSSFFFFIT